jgi:predicted nucleic acid-binding protein
VLKDETTDLCRDHHPSAYFTSRSSPEMIEKRVRTRKWWSEAALACEMVSSPVVFRELARGRSAHVPARLALVLDLRMLEVTPDALRIAKVYVERRIMPANPFEDALHLAVASYHECDALATWNYRHLAKPNKFNQIRRLNMKLGLWIPVITTPKQLMGGSDEEEASERSPA